MQALPQHQHQPEKPLIDVAHAREVEDHARSREPQCLLKPTSGVADVFRDRISRQSESDAIFVRTQVNDVALAAGATFGSGLDKRAATRATTISEIACAHHSSSEPRDEVPL